MNIFEDHEGIVGRVDAEGMARELREFFELAGEIRGKLGARGYLLDRYISLLLAAANETLCGAAAEQGFVAGSALRGICRDAIGGKDGRNPMFALARAHLEAHPMPYLESSTKTAILMVAMMDEYVECAAALLLEDQEHALLRVVDVVQIKKLYDEIAELLGGEALMERLNLLFRERFLAVPVMAAFMQGLANDLAYALSHRDIETSRQVFQLILDRLHEESEANA